MGEKMLSHLCIYTGKVWDIGSSYKVQELEIDLFLPTLVSFNINNEESIIIFVFGCMV